MHNSSTKERNRILKISHVTFQDRSWFQFSCRFFSTEGTSPFLSLKQLMLSDSNSQKQYSFARNTLESNWRQLNSQMEKYLKTVTASDILNNKTTAEIFPILCVHVSSPSAEMFVRLYSILKFSMRFPLNLDFSARSQVFLCLLLYCLRCFQLGERLLWPLLVEAVDLGPGFFTHLGLSFLTEVSGSGLPCGVTHQQYPVSSWHCTGA